MRSGCWSGPALARLREVAAFAVATPATVSNPGGSRTPSRVLPISSIRFVLAAWVALGHFGIPILQAPQQGRILWVVRGLVNNAVSGQAAVIVFFVISGFCIHFPNRAGLAVGS